MAFKITFPQTRKCGEQTDGWRRGGELGSWAEKVKGLEAQIGSYRVSCGNVKFSTGNRVNDIVMTVYGARWVLDVLGVGVGGGNL